MTKGRIGGNTPERVVTLITEAVAKSSQSAVARESGLGLLTVQRCLKGIGEPSQATLEKLAVYFGKSVVWLRGGEDISPNNYVGIAISAFFQSLFDYAKSKKEPDPSETFKNIAEAIKAEFPSMTEDEIQRQMSYIKDESLNKISELMSKLDITIKKPVK